MQSIRCMKCGKKMNDNERCCSYCMYQNNLENGYIDENSIISKPGEKRVLDHKGIVKKIVITVITTAMIGLSAAGAVFILSADKDFKISMGLMSSSEITLKKDVKELLRGAKFGMSREEIMRLENNYSDSIKEFNNEEYITYTACKYGGVEGRTTYKFTANKLNEISVVFYPQEDSTAAYESLISIFTKEYGEPLEPEEEADSAIETQWNNKKVTIKLKGGDYINLIVFPGKQ